MNVTSGNVQVVPYVMVHDGPGFIRFLQETFDAQTGTILTGKSGKKIIHGELKIGESVLYFADGTEDDAACDDDCTTPEQQATHPSKEPSTIHLYVYVQNAAEVMAKAEKAGGVSVLPVTDEEKGQTGGFLDPFHHLWWVKSVG